MRNAMKSEFVVTVSDSMMRSSDDGYELQTLNPTYINPKTQRPRSSSEQSTAQVVRGGRKADEGCHLCAIF